MSCSQIRKGSHWYYHCHNVHPTGLYKNTGYDSMSLYDGSRKSVKDMTLKIESV